MNNNQTKNTKPLKETLFERIESERVCPKSRLIFQSKECFVWFFWFLSVVIGALAVAVSLFVVIHHQFAFYEATHNNFFTFMVDVLPYLWILMFLIMVYVAIYNLKHTAHGYRYPVWVILSSSLVLSFAGGSALQLFGFGYTVDKILGDHMDMYVSQEKLEKKMWQDPDDGRLVGKQVFSTLAPTSTIVFEDVAGRRWRMDVSELPVRDLELLATNKTVKLIGKSVNEKVHIFHACGAFSWMMEKDVTLAQMNEERRVFVQRVSEHAKKAKEQLFMTGERSFDSAVLPRQSVCATIAPVRKMPVGDEFGG